MAMVVVFVIIGQFGRGCTTSNGREVDESSRAPARCERYLFLKRLWAEPKQRG
jgi:hypothetical protein